MNNQAMSSKKAFTIPEACTLAGVGRSRLYLEIKEGRLTARKVGRRTIIRSEDLDRWLDQAPVAGVNA